MNPGTIPRSGPGKGVAVMHRLQRGRLHQEQIGVQAEPVGQRLGQPCRKVGQAGIVENRIATGDQGARVAKAKVGEHLSQIRHRQATMAADIHPAQKKDAPRHGRAQIRCNEFANSFKGIWRLAGIGATAAVAAQIGVEDMVAPSSVDLQIALRHALIFETAFFQHPA